MDSHGEAITRWLGGGALPQAHTVGLGGNTLVAEAWADIVAPCRDARPGLRLVF